MTIAEDKNRDNKVVPFRSIKGGKEDGENWLKDLAVQTVFTSKMNSQLGTGLDLFCVLFHGKKVSKLCLRENNTEQVFFVETEEFSKRNRLVEILIEPIPELE